MTSSCRRGGDVQPCTSIDLVGCWWLWAATVVMVAAVAVQGPRHRQGARPVQAVPPLTGTISFGELVRFCCADPSLSLLATACVSGWTVAAQPEIQGSRGLVRQNRGHGVQRRVGRGTSLPPNPTGLGEPSTRSSSTGTADRGK